MKTPPSATSQSDKFKQAARELGVDLDEAKLAETLRKLAKHESEKKKSAED